MSNVGKSTLIKYFMKVYLANVSIVGTVTADITYLVESNSISGTSHYEMQIVSSSSKIQLSKTVPMFGCLTTPLKLDFQKSEKFF
jgi:GTPase SAR1 family protein